MYIYISSHLDHVLYDWIYPTKMNFQDDSMGSPIFGRLLLGVNLWVFYRQLPTRKTTRKTREENRTLSRLQLSPNI